MSAAARRFAIAASLTLGVVVRTNAASAAPSLADVPLASLPPIPTSAPKSVPKGNDSPLRVFPSANGTVIVVHKDAGGSQQAQQLGGNERAKLSTTPGISACVGWSQQSVAAFRQTLLYMNKDQSVMAVRTEVLEERPDGASLLVSDFWVDAKTTGVAVASPTVTIPLRRVSAPSEAAIYAFRTEKAASPVPAADTAKPGETVKAPDKEQSVVLVAGSVQGGNFQGSSGRTMSSQCDIAFAEIDVKDGAGTVQGQVNKMLVIEETRPRAPDTPPSTMPFQRSLQISASVSQTSRDPSPLFSISTRWLTDLPAQFKMQKL